MLLEVAIYKTFYTVKPLWRYTILVQEPVIVRLCLIYSYYLGLFEYMGKGTFRQV